MRQTHDHGGVRAIEKDESYGTQLTLESPWTHNTVTDIIDVRMVPECRTRPRAFKALHQHDSAFR